LAPRAEKAGAMVEEEDICPIGSDTMLNRRKIGELRDGHHAYVRLVFIFR
jgi:hypothetical protein